MLGAVCVVQVQAMRGRRGLDPSVDTQLGEDVADVDAGRLAADEKGVGDLLVRPSFGHESEDFELAGCEAGYARA